MAGKGLQKLTGYQVGQKSMEIQDKKSFADQLNKFYARFDETRFDYRREQEQLRDQMYKSTSDKCDFKESDIRLLFRGLNRHKAPGPGVTPAVLKMCSEELAPVFKVLFDKSVSDHCVSEVLKTSIIVPVSKKNIPEKLNDYRPVALTSVYMKCLERLILKEILQVTTPGLDENQFAYRPNRGAEDSLLTLLHRIFEHLDKQDVYARILFTDFSSAFNTLQPHT